MILAPPLRPAGRPAAWAVALVASTLAACGGSSTPATPTVQAPTGLAYSANPATYTVGTPVAANTPSSGGGAVDRYSILPGLPAGLTFSTTTGVISGTPTAASSATSHTVTAVNSAGTASVRLTITVAPAACTPNTPQPSALPVAQVLELGTRAVGTDVTFDVPAGTGSVTILQQGKNPAMPQTITFQGTSVPNVVVPLSITVGGVQFYDDYEPPSPLPTPFDPATWGSPNGIGAIYSGFGSTGAWTGSLTVPNTTNMLSYVASNGGVPSGTWRVTVNDWALECLTTPNCTVSNYVAGTYDVKVLLKPGPVGASGTIDVNFYLVTDQYDAAGFDANPSVVRMKQSITNLFARAGIAVGAFRSIDLPASVKARYAAGVDIDDGTACGDVATLLQMSEPGRGMNIFLANELISQGSGGGYQVVGVDGTIPGPATVGGTVSSGAFASVADLTYQATQTSCTGSLDPNRCGADLVAYITAHETGHFLGLFHTTEANGDLFDPIADTDKCPCTTCATQVSRCTSPTSPYYMTGTDCTKSTSCGGGDDLMFWLISGSSTGVISADQASIMRANALIQ